MSSRPDRRPLRFVLGYLARRPAGFAGLGAILVTAASASVGVQYAMKRIVDLVATGDRSDPDLWSRLVAFCALIAIESVMWRLGGFVGSRLIVDTGVDVRLDLFDRLAGHPMRFFSDQLAGSLGSRITATAGATGALLGALAWQIVPPCVDLLGAVALFATIDARMSLALVASVAAIGAAVLALGLRGQPLHRAYAEQGTRVNGELVDVVANVWTVKAFSARAREHRRLREAFEVEAGAQRRSWWYVERIRVLHDALLWAMSGAMLAWICHRWQQGRGTAGDVVLVSALTFRILHGSRDLALAFVGVLRQLAEIRVMLDLIARPHTVVDRPDARPLVRPAGAIRLERVSYGYGDGDVLRDFDLDVRPGERLGVVGPSGAGKSTLVGLLQRLDDVRSGRILIDGHPIDHLPQDALRAAIAVVPQDVALFHRSVLENVRYGRPDASFDEVLAAARAARCDEFVDALPRGWDTVVGERGTRLSGGQRQRIGLARAFLKDAPILILDEATSALDSRSEAELQRALHRLMRGRTVLAVAHRLATVSAFDRVVVVVDGQIVEEGPPSELRRRGGVFAEMWQLQAEGFDLDAA